jgi:hypothetical protein
MVGEKAKRYVHEQVTAPDPRHRSYIDRRRAFPITEYFNVQLVFLAVHRKELPCQP